MFGTVTVIIQVEIKIDLYDTLNTNSYIFPLEMIRLHIFSLSMGLKF